jgi:hypothetical protein
MHRSDSNSAQEASPGSPRGFAMVARGCCSAPLSRHRRVAGPRPRETANRSGLRHRDTAKRLRPVIATPPRGREQSRETAKRSWRRQRDRDAVVAMQRCRSARIARASRSLGGKAEHRAHRDRRRCSSRRSGRNDPRRRSSWRSPGRACGSANQPCQRSRDGRPLWMAGPPPADPWRSLPQAT